MSKMSRLEKLRKVRSFNDVLAVLREIRDDVASSAPVVGVLVKSLSGDEISMQDKRVSALTKVDVFKAPRVTELKKHVDIINKLYENALELDNAEAVIKQSFADHKKQPAALKAVIALRDEVNNNINDALDALSLSANKHQPTLLTTLVDKVVAQLLKVLPANSYNDMTKAVYVSPGEEKGTFAFCNYIGIENLTDEKGYAYQEFIITITGVITTGGEMKLHVNSLPGFKPPGRFPIGPEVKDFNGALKRIELLLAHSHIISETDKLTMPVDTTRAKNLGLSKVPGVADVAVDDDELIVSLESHLKPDSPAVEKIVVAVLGRLNAVVGANVKAKVFKYSVVKKGTKTSIRFVLVPNVERHDKGLKISTAKLREATDFLGLTEDQVKAFRFALQH